MSDARDASGSSGSSGSSDSRKVLTEGEVDAALQERRLRWRRDGGELVKEVDRGNFAGSLAYVNRVGALAEAANHHPDVDIRWNKVLLRLSTHSAGGLTGLDLALAAQIDELDGDGT